MRVLKLAAAEEKAMVVRDKASLERQLAEAEQVRMDG